MNRIHTDNGEYQTMKISISKFVRRQTPASRFSHWEISDGDLLGRVLDGYMEDDIFPGYRDGVILVRLGDVRGFFSSTVVLQDGDVLRGAYESRCEGENPRIHFGLDIDPSKYLDKKRPSRSVFVVLYRADVLAETNERSDMDADWEIISVNCSTEPLTEPEPIPVEALLANHFGGLGDGGTRTNMTPSQFEEALRASYNYWKNKAGFA